MLDIRSVSIEVVAELCSRYHGYQSAGKVATYAFAVFENEIPVAAFSWQPPPPGAAAAICKDAPYAVLALSRMVAVPREARQLRHISKPLRQQMKRLIDRTRWPVLVTYSDEGQGHTGHVYKCSGWRSTARAVRRFHVDSDGARASSYSNGKSDARGLLQGGKTVLQRWEHWACEPDNVVEWIHSNGWRRVPLDGRKWKSGNPAFTWVRQ